MKTRNFFSTTLLISTLALPGVLFTSCGKDDNEIQAPTSNFTASDFQLTIVSHGQGAGNSYYSMEYILKNISNKQYDVNSTDDLVIKFAVKDGSGNTYTEKRIIPTMDPGTSITSKISTISLPSGITVNSSTFTARVEKE